MKVKARLSAAILAVLAIFLFVNIPAEAATETEYESGGLKYTKSGVYATITGYTGTSGVLNIPEELDGYTVTAISERAFEGNTNITSVTIPKNVTSIGNCAFKDCANLSSITINAIKLSDADSGSADDFYSPRRSIFYGAGSTSGSISVTFGEEVTYVPGYLFATGDDNYCHVTSVEMSSTIAAIGDGAFYNCRDLEGVTIPEKVTSIGEHAFGNCPFKKVTIPEKVTSIGAYAFENCPLESVTIPKNVTSIGSCAFKDCANLSSVTINAIKLSDADGGSADDFYSPRRSIFYGAGWKSGSISVTFGEGVTYVPGYLFATGDDNYCHVTSVEMSSTIIAIGDGAFYNCRDLEGVTIPEKVTSVGKHAFGNCPFKKVTIPEKVTSIGAYAFENCPLESVTIPKNVTSIGSCAFKDCADLSSVTINAIKLSDADGGSADDFYSPRRSIFYGAGWKSRSISVTFGEGVTYVPGYLFATGDDNYCHVTSVEMSSTIAAIGDGAFYNCRDLEGVTIPEKVTSIGERAFGNCPFKNVTIPEKVTSIGAYAFENCPLESVTIPKNVTSIGSCAFKDCADLSSITINAINLSDADGGSADDFYSPRRSIFYGAGSKSGSISVTFGEGVTRVPAYLFATGEAQEKLNYCRITEVYIPASVTTIGTGAFYNCYLLDKVEIQSRNAEFGKEVFANCTVPPTIHCYSGSTAETYANDNDLKISYLVSHTGWRTEGGVKYWYENDVKQGLEGRGKEIYDPDSDAWYWLDSVDGGKMAVSKDVYQESKAGQWGDYIGEDGELCGKWVRYDENGHMIKGWSENKDGRFYFDEIYGTMAKGYATIGNSEYYFNVATGVLERELGEVPEFGWKTIDGNDYWYENHVRQGYSIDPAYRGKEIFDPASDAWFWLDNVDGGKKAVSKDVYQESKAGQWGDYIGEDGERYGKWVRYDENGHMIKEWSGDGKYYFDPIYGTMAKGWATIDGNSYYFDEESGIMQ